MPEITENYIRIPVRDRLDSDNIVTLTISSEDGIKALYSTNRKKILTYLFDKDYDWAMEKAQAWVEQHKKRIVRERKATSNEPVERVIGMVKVDTAKRIVYGEVLVPYVVDLQGDFEEPEDIEEAANNFLIKYSENIGEMHYRWDGIGRPAQSYIAPVDILWGHGKKGPIISSKGTWIMAIKVMSDNAWNKVLNGEFTGLSIGYNGNRIKVD